MLCGRDFKLVFISVSVHKWKEVVSYLYFMKPPNAVFTICCWLEFKVTVIQVQRGLILTCRGASCLSEIELLISGEQNPPSQVNGQRDDSL